MHCLHERQFGAEHPDGPGSQRQADAVAAGQGSPGRIPRTLLSTLETKEMLDSG